MVPKSSLRILNTFISSDLDFNEFRYTVLSHVDGTYVQTDVLGGNTTRQWLEDVFELPATLTNKRKFTIRLVPQAGAPAWHAARYEVWSRARP